MGELLSLFVFEFEQLYYLQNIEKYSLKIIKIVIKVHLIIFLTFKSTLKSVVYIHICKLTSVYSDICTFYTIYIYIITKKVYIVNNIRNCYFGFVNIYMILKKKVTIMLKLTCIDFLRTMPETFIFIWGICIISNKVISKKTHIIYCILISIEIYIVRLLPIHFGVHTIINDIFTICLLIIAEISIDTAIRNTLLMTLLLVISEFFNIFLLKIFNINTEAQFRIPEVKSLFMVPSLLIFILFIHLTKFLLRKKAGKINVSD